VTFETLWRLRAGDEAEETMEGLEMGRQKGMYYAFVHTKPCRRDGSWGKISRKGKERERGINRKKTRAVGNGQLAGKKPYWGSS